ncbi:hypothetical protein AB6A40_005560 [Gnathostoma spinigerum]|uniref:Globin domain-containing protein n=1 Tax=Gnathostoma spinigerum TaxID=75299 RepID=A0ABD6EN41_9BILA
MESEKSVDRMSNPDSAEHASHSEQTQRSDWIKGTRKFDMYSSLSGSSTDTDMEMVIENLSSTASDDGEEMGVQIRRQLIRLTRRMREVIRETFGFIEADSTRNAVFIFVSLFAEHPRYKELWPKFRHTPYSLMMSDSQFKRSVDIIMEGLHSIVYSLNDIAVLEEVISRIANAHIKWNICKFHIMHMLDPVLALIASNQESKSYSKSEVIEAWTIFYDALSNIIEIYRYRASSNEIQ